MSAAPVVSVVTPVYNGERYLDECIQSVLRQTRTDWEFVIVDNCSTDASADIALRYAAKDRRIRVERPTQFLDALDNHNRSMRAIDPRSQYCKVVHADDWLYPDCLALMLNVAEAHPSVGVVSSFRLVGDTIAQQSPMPYTQTVVPGRDLVRWEFFGARGNAWVTGSPSTLLLRSDLVLQRPEFYDRTVWHSDTDAAYRVLMDSDFGFAHQVLTYTRRHSTNLMSFSQRVWSFMPRDVRLTIRYAPRVLGPAAYRSTLWRSIRDYGLWLTKQVVKPSRHRDHAFDEFRDFHSREIDYMLSEPNLDTESRLALRAYQRLLGGSPGMTEGNAAGPRPSTT